MRILGLSAFYHDSAAALIEDGRIVAAAQEERFTRRKHDAGFPRHAVAYCLDAAGCDMSGVDDVVFYDMPLLKFRRLAATYLALAPQGFASFRHAMPAWLGGKLFQQREAARRLLEFGGAPRRLKVVEHHLSHAASAFFPSPFESAAVLTVDGVGEWATATAAFGLGSNLTLEREIRFPHSLGLLYSAFTAYTGFKVNSGEYKVMGLAPYGEPRFAPLIREHLIDIRPDGSFRMDQSYFNYAGGLTMTAPKFHALFGGPPRRPDEPLTQRHMDLAASVQAVTEEAMLKLTRDLARRTRSPNLCMAGGVALNCVANGKIIRDGAFENVWVQPAAGDAGGALGAALACFHLMHGGERRVDGLHDAMQGGYLGPSYPQAEIERRLAAVGARFDVLSPGGTVDAVVGALAAEQAVGWCQGRMEFGPRALGARSIIADPRSPSMQKLLNLKVKFRESFRPFAPSVLREDLTDWFDIDVDSPYMLVTAPVRAERRRTMTAAEESLFGIDKLNVARSEIPAVTHVDYSARIQTVHADTNPRYHQLLSAFKATTGCPVLVNTSFNVRGEPIVATPEDAFRCFMGTDIEALAVGDCFLEKKRQDPALALDYKNAFELD